MASIMIGRTHTKYDLQSLQYLNMISAETPENIKYEMVASSIKLIYHYYAVRNNIYEYEIDHGMIMKFLVNMGYIYFNTDPRDSRIIQFMKQYANDFYYIYNINSSFISDMVDDITNAIDCV